MNDFSPDKLRRQFNLNSVICYDRLFREEPSSEWEPSTTCRTIGNLPSMVSMSGSTSSISEEPTDPLIQWLRENNAVITKVFPKNVPGMSNFSNRLTCRSWSRTICDGRYRAGRSHYSDPWSLSLKFGDTRSIASAVSSVWRPSFKTWWLASRNWARTNSWQYSWYSREYVYSLPPPTAFRGMPIFWNPSWQKRLSPAAYGSLNFLLVSLTYRIFLWRKLWNIEIGLGSCRGIPFCDRFTDTIPWRPSPRLGLR